MAGSIAASEDMKVEPSDHPQGLPLPGPIHTKYKSWRKKYRKMRSRFDDSMEEANTLFLSTHHVHEVAQRLQEQNDQLLEILSDLNTSHKVPSHHRYDVALPSDPTQQSTPPSHHDAPTGAIRLADLEHSVPHTLPSDLSKLPGELLDHDGNAPAGYLTPKHEDEYLAVIDNALDVIPLPSPSRPNIILDPSVDLRPRHNEPPTERDFATQNPISVHNWLLRNKPATKAPDPDLLSERGDAGSTAAGPTATKKKGGQSKKEKTKEDAPFEGLDDEIGFDAEEVAGAKKGRRKTGDNDHTYRPKGGRSRAAPKRKRERGDEGEEGGGKRVRGEDE